jgi:cell shape-determining protein MreD
MAYYIVIPFFALLLVVLQRTLLDLVFGGRIGIEVSLILVVWAGFHLDMLRGGVLAFVLGFLLDCLSGTILGLTTFVYVGGNVI